MKIATRRFAAGLATALVAVLGAQPGAHATELIYYPVNPAFGGSPLNGNWMLGLAQAQNKHKDPDADTGFGGLNTSPLQNFNDALERAVLSQLAAAASSQIMGTDGSLRPGTVQTGNYIIDIVDLGGGLLRITTTDKLLGTSTSFQVGK
ncbi:curli assembly protein CsgF [Verticiella sediminum]|uniref:Curli production assembly/transport component CsgF n=1 Tax=Verticiella sediminum TaxID=1247510 RepID=A0A556AC71_9BURK|nr:curli assembly protein CsgF [Verticiella sediminum]TSH90485.1 curli assembly protein CsgF [Verticiella sediminum]